MKNDNIGIDFFCVSLIENLETLKKSILIMNNLYEEATFTIICPQNSIYEFQNEFQVYENVKILDENSILPMQVFLRIASNIFIENNLDEKTIKNYRLNWYYQQVLKISFTISNNQQGKKIVMWDADTIPLKKIKFFKNGKSILYGSLSEFNEPYFKTIKSIFRELPKNFRAFTVQFFSCTYDEINFLIKKFESYIPKRNVTNGEWTSMIILKSVIETHGTLEGSLISEQEVVGISNLIHHNSQKTQKNIIYIRFRLTGLLNKNQIKLIKYFGFSHLTYEMWSIVNQKQKWGELVTIILKEYYTSLRFFINKPKV